MDDLDWSATGAGIAIAIDPPARLCVLRLRQPADSDLDRIERALSITLPRLPNRVQGQAAWMAPGEWLLIDVDPGPVGDAGPACTWHVADVSDGRIAYTVTGRHAADLIAKGCPLDLSPRVFAVDACAQSSLAQVRVLIRRHGDDGYTIHADASFAAHLQQWFGDAIHEFRLGDLN